MNASFLDTELLFLERLRSKETFNLSTFLNASFLDTELVLRKKDYNQKETLNLGMFLNASTNK